MLFKNIACLIVSLIRSFVRGCVLGAIIFVAIGDFLMRVSLTASRRDMRARARWLQRWCRAAVWLIHLKIETRGPQPTSGLLVSNHLSYLDIIALSALMPCVFVAKREVASWPAFGLLARLGGTIFVDRTRRADAPRVAAEMRRLIEEGVLVVLFPEGTSSGGDTVLPFKSSLFAPVAEMNFPVASCALRYFLDRGSPAEEICYWRDMTLLPHLLHLLGLRGIRLVVNFSESRPRAGGRKEIARDLQAEVVSLHVATK